MGEDTRDVAAGSPPDDLLGPLYAQTQDIWHSAGVAPRSLERVVDALLDLGWTPPAFGPHRHARRAVAWVVEAAGGRVVVPRSVMQRDWLLTAEDTIDGGRRFISAARTPREATKETNDGG